MDVEIFIYDIKGRLVDRLFDNNIVKGYHEVDWDASIYPSGIYFVNIISEDVSISQKLILMK